MAKLVVIGALALDRPVKLNGRPCPGARLQGYSLGGVLAARLGGGGANSSAALARAGHQVRLVATAASDADGDLAVAFAEAAGLDISHIQRREGASRTTIIFIDPTGERIVLSLDPGEIVLANLPHLPPPPADPIQGLYVRAPYPGAQAWAEAAAGPIVAHWPCPGFIGPCDVVVASADDCAPEVLSDPYGAGREALGERLSWFVMTHGAGEVVAYDGRRQVRVAPRPAQVVDATGAGDVFAAGLLDALVAGAEMEEALAHACEWGGVAVGLEASAPTEGEFRSLA